MMRIRLSDENIRRVELFYTEVEFINARKDKIKFYCANSTV